MEPDTHQKVAIVTGAGGTLASEMALALARKGHKIALLGRSINKLRAVEDQIKAEGSNALSISVDVTDIQAVEKVRDLINAELGIATILINSAGGNKHTAITTVREYDPKELDQNEKDIRGFFNLDMQLFKGVLEANTMGTVIPCQVFGKDMATLKGGNIINMASMVSFRPLSRVAPYIMAKMGIVGFTQWLAAYLAPANIRVNAIAPGFFPNDRSRQMLTTPEGGLTKRGEAIINQTPMRKFGEAKQLVGTMNWLLDDEASGFITGTVIPVDGGFLVSPII